MERRYIGHGLSLEFEMDWTGLGWPGFDAHIFLDLITRHGESSALSGSVYLYGI
jgi:hypothetical protein